MADVGRAEINRSPSRVDEDPRDSQVNQGADGNIYFRFSIEKGFHPRRNCPGGSSRSM